jgi:hypothetical protein
MTSKAVRYMCDRSVRCNWSSGMGGTEFWS